MKIFQKSKNIPEKQKGEGKQGLAKVLTTYILVRLPHP
jgi:hypothetical protein